MKHVKRNQQNAAPPVSLGDQIKFRREKLAQLQAEGMDPFAITRFVSTRCVYETAVRQAEQLRHIGGDHNDRLAFLCKLRHQLVNFALCADIDTARRLVENEHIAVAQEPFGNDDLLL